MKKGAIIFSIVLIIVVIAASTLTYAFFSRSEAEFTITLSSAATTTVVLELSTDNQTLRPPTATANNTQQKYAYTDAFAAYKISYEANADIANAKIFVSDISLSKNGVQDKSSNEYRYLSQNGVFQYYFKLYPGDAPGEVNPTGETIADNAWKNGAGDVEAYKVSFDPDVGNLFTKGDTGTIVFFVRFAPGYTDELIPPKANGANVAFSITIEPTDAE